MIFKRAMFMLSRIVAVVVLVFFVGVSFDLLAAFIAAMGGCR